jgi:hypothetical protein
VRALRAAIPPALLALSVLLGVLAGAGGSGGTVLDTLDSGAERIRGVLATVLYLDLDNYHHIMIYQGRDWTAITDYLPQLWLITRLDPGFAQAYDDGAYHLAVNLGRVDEGLELIEQGMRNCPSDRELVWQNLVIRWQTSAGTPSERFGAFTRFAGSSRRGGFDTALFERERNSTLIASWILESAGTLRDSLFAARYRARADVITLWRRYYLIRRA